MDNTANAPAGAAGTTMLAAIGIVFLVIGIGIGYVAFSAPSTGGTVTTVNSTAVKYAESGNYTINETAIRAQIAAFNRINELRGANFSLIYQSSKVDDDGLIEALVLDTSTGSAAKVYFSKTGKYINIMDATQQFPIDVVNYSIQMEAAAANASVAASTANKTDKPTVELFVMSYCPYGTQEEKGIIPAVEALKGKINFSVKFVYYSMHGWKEMEENTRQYCIQKEQNDRYIPYLACFLNDSNYSRCIVNANISQASLGACMNATDAAYNITGIYNDQANWLNGQFPVYPIDMAENQLYGVQGSPTLIINGAAASSGRNSASLLSAICNAFSVEPAECGTTLSSVSPSSGFGYTGAGDSGAAAQCGG
jgi:hypothetical protein